METIIQSLMASKIFVVIIILIVAILIYSILKKLLKMMIFMLIALILYVGYMFYTGQKIPTSAFETIKYGEKKIKEIKQESEKIINTMQLINKSREEIDQSNTSASE